MTKEIKVWGDGYRELWSFRGTVDIPKGFVEVPTGNHFLTRTIKKRADCVYVRMKKHRKGNFSRAIGIMAPRNIVEDAKQLAQETEEDRLTKREKAAEYRAKQEELHRKHMQAEILRLYPNMPPKEAGVIADHAFEVGSGRVGRVSAIDLNKKLELAVKAHIRHQHTEYDDMLNDGWEKEDARRQIAGQVEKIHGEWKGGNGIDHED